MDSHQSRSRPVRRPFAFPALTSFGLALGLAACVVEELPAEEAGFGSGPILGESTAALASDPATANANGWCYNNWTWNGTNARTYYPANGDCSSSLYSPLVLIMPGNGFDQTHYHQLAQHLARNRHIVVVVDTVAQSGGVALPNAANYQAAAATAWAFVTDFAFGVWSKRFFINPNQVALIGHSRGGEGVRYLADQLAADPVFEVRAVVTLAGTDHTGKYLGAGDAVAALVLHGSLDGDVPVVRSGHSYDRTGTELSQNDPGATPSVLDKTFKLMVGGDHPSFSDKNEGLVGDKPTQRAAAKGYVLAFLKAHLANDWTWVGDYIRGSAVPGGYAGAVTTQTADGLLRRVIDHFEDAVNGTNALGGSVQKSASIAWSSVNLGLDPNSAHATLAMALTVNGAGWVQWNVPAGKRDTNAFAALSLRLGQRAGAATTAVTVQLLNGVVWSPALTLTNYGPIAQPMAICDPNDNSPGCFAYPTPLSHLSTIRVPLSAFGAHNDVQAVRVSFGAGAVGAQLVIDSLEVAHPLLAP
jgi:hypothetical protein